ncbi:MAG TPA: STAS domain-containing protein [Mycobacteriales bacterium]|nr:STAS domain-containing protein [Mycobacteriales bacterium]
MQSKCETEVRSLPGCAVIEIRGEVDGSAAAVLSSAYDSAVARDDARCVLLDFARVDYINSTGIALIVSVLAKARSENRQVIASGLSDHYRQIFAITRLSDFIQLYDDIDAAAAGAGVA